MLSGIRNAFRIRELRNKILFTLGVLLLYRLGSYVPLPGIPFQELYDNYSSAADTYGAIAMLDLFSGGALSNVSVFTLGIMPYITAQIIMQLMQGVVPSLQELASEGEAGQARVTQYTRYLSIGLSTISAIGYLFLFKSSSFGVSFDDAWLPNWLMNIVVVVTMVAGSVLIMWMGELITQRGIGNGMSLIIFANILSGLPSAIIESVLESTDGLVVTILVLLVVCLCIPFITFIERGQRRIPVQFAKRVVGRRIMGGNSTYLPIKVNTAGVVPIIFASTILYLPAQIAVFFTDVDWINTLANAVSSGWINWILTCVLIVAFAYFYASMVFDPKQTADMLRKQGGFIPGVRPGTATENYVRNAVHKITLPGALFMVLLAVVPSIIFSFTSISLIETLGGTSILIMVGTAIDTLSQLEGQLKMHNYDGLFE